MIVRIQQSNHQSVCHLCGKKLDLFDRQQKFTIHKRVRYGSSYDGETVCLNLCCDCFDKLVAECRVSPLLPGGDR